MTTDTQPLTPTDAEIATLIDKEMREYSIGAYADHGSAKNQLEHFARAVLAKWGAQPVPAGYSLVPVEPSAEMVDAAQEAYMPFGDMQLAIQLAIAAAPQPVAREPLTLEQIDEIHLANSDAYERGDVEYESHGFARAVEAHHGIKGGQHGAE